MTSARSQRHPPGAPLVDLVHAAAAGDHHAWNSLVDRFAPLVWSVCRSFRLGDADAADVTQTVWLTAVEKLGTLRTPEALPGWIVTTTRRECIKVTGRTRRVAMSIDMSEFEFAADDDVTALDADLLAAERREVARSSFGQLPVNCQKLLSLVILADDVSYAAISSQLGIPTGSIGPTRSRCLAKLRSTPAMASWLATQAFEGTDR